MTRTAPSRGSGSFLCLGDPLTTRVVTTNPRAGFFRKTFTAFLAVLLAVGALSAAGPAAFAGTGIIPGINIDVLHNGTVVQDGDPIPEGDTVLLRLQYDAAEDIAGTEIIITLPANITVSGALPGNEAIDEIVNNGDGTITIKFKDPLPEGVIEGALAIVLQTQPVDGDEPATITWKVGDDEGSVTIVVENDVEPPTYVTNGFGKSVTPSNLDSFVQRAQDADGNYYFVGLNPDIENQVLTYTLVINSLEARDSFSVADSLPAGLEYVPGMFNAQITTYNPESTSGFGFVPTVVGDSFTGVVSVPENSTLRITYQVMVSDSAALEASLRAQFDALGGSPGNFQIVLRNTATFGDDINRSADVRIRGNVPGVGVGTAFAKSGNWTHREVIAAEDGALEPPVEISYSFRANLTVWDERNPNFTLGQNVVVSDTLPVQAEWKTAETDFITATGLILTEAGTCPSDLADFADDAFVGQWCVDGQTLLINVGRDNSTNAQIEAKAQMNSVAGLAEQGSTTILGATSFLLPNTAQFFYRAGSPHQTRHNAYPIVLPADRDGGINDSAVFVKAGPDSDVRVNPGESADVPYRFTIDTSREGIDPLKSKIVDEVNTDIFDISDPQSIPVSGSYGTQALTFEHFALSTDAQGDLVIELSELGRQVVGDFGPDELWVIDIVLTTIPLEGKQTLEIYNRATLFGNDDDPDYWSDSTIEATSYGDEAELRKRVYDTERSDWAVEVDALIENGQFVEDRFVYSIEVIPRGTYGTAFPVQLFDREDVLPGAVEFLGFVDLDVDGAPDMGNLSNGPKLMNGNVVAVFDNGVVTIQQQDGTNLNANDGRIVVHFAVRAIDASASIVNSVVGSDATIKPYGDQGIDIEKWTDEGMGPEYDSSGALLNDGFDGDFDEAPGKQLVEETPMAINFTVSNDGREDLIDVVVTDRRTAGVGDVQDLVCVFPDDSTGTRWDGPFLVGEQFHCTGTLPALRAGESHSDTASVTGFGLLSGTQVSDDDDWHGFVPNSPSSGLAFTGGTVSPMAVTAALLLLFTGGVAVVVTRRIRVGARR